MPQELRPTAKRKPGPSAVKPSKPKKLKSPEEIESKLQLLEQKEVETLGKDEKEIKRTEESESEEEKEEDEKMDQDLEDDLDYGNNYFDNGEGYDEDDQDDEGPVY